jgi:hypothetical protein
MICVCTASQLAADTSSEVVSPEKECSRTTGKYPRRTPVRDLCTAFGVPYIYDCVTDLRSQQREVIQNHGNANVWIVGQGSLRRSPAH